MHGDGRIVIPDGPEIRVTEKFGITVRGDYLRFADKHGEDLARLAGYRRGAYALGYYGDLHDPFDAVRGESSDGLATFSPVSRS